MSAYARTTPMNNFLAMQTKLSPERIPSVYEQPGWQHGLSKLLCVCRVGILTFSVLAFFAFSIFSP